MELVATQSIRGSKAVDSGEYLFLPSLETLELAIGIGQPRKEPGHKGAHRLTLLRRFDPRLVVNVFRD